MFGCFFAFSYHFIDPMRWRLFIGVNHVCSPLYMGDFCDTLILQPQPQVVHIVPEVDDFLLQVRQLHLVHQAAAVFLLAGHVLYRS